MCVGRVCVGDAAFVTKGKLLTKGCEGSGTTQKPSESPQRNYRVMKDKEMRGNKII